MPSSAPELSSDRDPSGPDPIYGLGMVVVGVLIMGVAGAATWHFVFNAGTALTILGALVFVSSLAASSMRDSLKARAARKQAARAALAAEKDKPAANEFVAAASVETEAEPKGTSTVDPNVAMSTTSDPRSPS